MITNKERFGSPRRATTFRTFEGYDCLRSRNSEGIRNIGLDLNLSLWSGQLFLAQFCLEKKITYKLCIVYLSIYSVWCLSYFVIWASNDLRAADRPILMIASWIVFRQPLKLWRNFAPLSFFQIPPQFKLLFGFCSSSVFFQKVPKFQVIVVFCSSFVVF